MKQLNRQLAFLTLILALALFGIQAGTAAAGPALAPAATFTVNSNLDTNDGTCDVTNCTLREAITAANANANADTINFSLGSGTPTIVIGAAGLPTISQPVTINGNTGGATRVELNGDATPLGGDGLTITGGSTTLRNLVINRFGGVGIVISTNGGNLVEGCYIGFGADGATDQSNRDGIYIFDSSNNTIGGTTAARNIITASRDGIFVESLSVETTGNVIQGNYIGTDVTGMLARGGSGGGVSLYSADGNTIGGTTAGTGNVISDFTGIGIDLSDADDNFIQGNIVGLAVDGSTALGNFSGGIELIDSSGNTIGGTTHTAGTCDGACNVISANDADGIAVVGFQSTSNDNLIQGNFIGTDKNGTADRGNSFDGIWVPGGTGNTIGGTDAGAGNLISGNNDNGIFFNNSGGAGNLVQGNIIGLDINGTNDLGNSDDGIRINNGASNNIIGGTSTAARNIISGNDSVGMRILDSTTTGTIVRGNYIGTNAAGTADLGNTFSGIYMNASQNTTIGGTDAGAGNVISGNNSSGVFQENGASGTAIQGNRIGTNAEGTGDLGNSFDGVFIGSGSNTIGGTSANTRNVIAGNDTNGIEIFGATATPNTVQGNYIGTDATGTADLGNGFDGIFVNSASNTIGGTDANARNVIAGNNRNGIQIDGTSAAGNQVIGNFIGTNAGGTGDLGNTFEGVFIDGAPNNTIGGTTSVHRNVISGNDDAGVDIFGSNATGNLVQGNYIGTQVDGTSALANSFVGVWIEGSASSNTIGGTASGAANVIAFNTQDGVFVENGTGNQIRRNSIFSNGGLGIDLGADGVTANDNGTPPDTDTGANNLQNFPVLATAQQGSTIITGSFNSTPNTSFTLEFFSSTSADGTGNGEGQTFLCDATVTTNASGAASINVTCPTTTTAGHVVTATATRNTAPFDTSEFSGAVTVSAPTAVTLSEFSGKVVDGRVHLRWTTGNEAQLVGFNVWRQRKKGEPEHINAELVPAQRPGMLEGAEYSFDDIKVRSGKKYIYRLEAVLSDGRSEWSESVQLKLPKDANACAAKPKAAKLLSPQNGETVRPRRAHLDWTDANCATSYVLVIRKGDADGKIVERVEGVTTSEFVTQRLKRGETYHWTVSACSIAGCSKTRQSIFMVRP